MSRRTTWRNKFPNRKGFFRKKATVPVHPKDHYWYAVGAAHGRDKRRSMENSFARLLQEPNGGGSFYERYKDMYEAGFKAARKGK